MHVGDVVVGTVVIGTSMELVAEVLAFDAQWNVPLVDVEMAPGLADGIEKGVFAETPAP